LKAYAAEAIFHESNSRFAYALSETQIQVRIQTKKNDMSRIDVFYADVYNWDKIDGDFRWIHHTSPMIKRFSDEYSDYYVATLEVANKRFKYAFCFDESVIFGQLGMYEGLAKDNHIHNYFTYPYINLSDMPKTPEWLEGLTWYQIFVDRFHTSTPLLDWSTHPVNNQMIFGGSLQGIIDKLDYLSDLGIQGIYLNPIFDSPTAHKYDTTDYYTIDPSFGSLDDLKQLVQLAHERNIKVMLDGVFNHAGYDHPFFQDVIKHKASSPYHDYFLVHSYPIQRKAANGKPSYETFAFASNMPKWNTNNPDVVEYLSDIAAFYVKEADIDGWRMDVSEEPSRGLWHKINEKINAIKSDVWLLAENWYDTNSWLSNHQFDSVMNYNYMFTIVDFVKGKITASEVATRLQQLFWRYPDTIINQLFNVIDTHDTARIKTIVPEYFNAVIGFIFTMPGTPSLYYGTEAGMEGEHDPDCRRPMVWDAIDQDQYKLTKSLIQLRKEPAAQQLEISFWSENNVLFWLKEGPTSLLGVISKESTISIPSAYIGKRVYDVLQQEEVMLESTRSIPHFIGIYLIKE
jgi:cyclomaltodextrinase / maltogenic alpha-amylase / neopullulanase